MSEGILNGHLSTTSLSVVWATKEVEDKNNNNNQHHQYSRRRQFFTTSFSFLSPFLNSSPYQLYLWSGHTSWEAVLENLKEKKIVFRCGDGSKFRAFYAKDWGKKRFGLPRGNYVTEVVGKLVDSNPGSAKDDFVIKRIGRLDVAALQASGVFGKTRKQYKAEIDMGFADGLGCSEALAKSRFANPNLVLPRVIVLGDPETGAETGRTFRPLWSITRREGVGSLEKVSGLLLEHSPKFREMILSQIIKGALEGLKHIHSTGFVYGHFDPSNIIVCEDKTTGKLTGKLTKFNECFKAELSCLKFGCHLAPECRQQSEHILMPSFDLWELGSCLFFLFTGKPYRDKALEEHPLDKMKLPPKWTEWTEEDKKTLEDAHLDPWLICLISILLAPIPRARPSINQVLNSQWMQKCESEIGRNREYMVEISKIIEMLKSGDTNEDSTMKPGTSYHDYPAEYPDKEFNDQTALYGMSSTSSLATLEMEDSRLEGKGNNSGAKYYD